MPTPYQTLLGQAQLDIGRAFGVGGDQWAGERTTGDGEVTPVITQQFTVTAYVRQIVSPQVQATADAFTSNTDWVLVAPLGQDIQVGDVVSSVTEPAYQFQVLTISTIRGMIDADVERVVNGNA